MLKRTLISLSLCLGLGLSSIVIAAPTTITNNQTVAGNKVATTQPILAYFESIDEDNTYSATPVKDGFYRTLLGRDGKGYYLVQDFFQNSGKMQSDPYWISSAEGLTSFNIDYVEGPLKGYFTNGKVSFQGRMSNGYYAEKFESFYPSGVVANRVTPIANDHTRDEYFYQDGKKAVVIEYDAEGETIKTEAWDNKGKKATDSESITDAILEGMRFDQ